MKNYHYIYINILVDQLTVKFSYEKMTTLKSADFGQVTTLEFNSFLERQLWPSFDTKASPAHLITIALLINEKALIKKRDLKMGGSAA